MLNEQGASIVRDLARIAASVTPVVTPRLLALFARSFPQTRCRPAGACGHGGRGFRPEPVTPLSRIRFAAFGGG